jgi:hypothetical protein
MKKKETKDQKQEGKPRRLFLDREVILVLNDPAFLKQAKGDCSMDSYTMQVTIE